MAYTQMFIDYLHAKDPFKLKFFDECGLKLPFHGKRLYGHAPVGERCIELLRYHRSPNITWATWGTIYEHSTWCIRYYRISSLLR